MTCDASWVGHKTTQFLGNLYCSGNPFLVVFHVFENSDSSREVHVDFGLVTTVNEGSTLNGPVGSARISDTFSPGPAVAPMFAITVNCFLN